MGVKSRLVEFIKYKGLGQAKFEISVGLSNGFVNNIGDSIRTDSLNKIRKQYPELNVDWLIVGAGEMLNVDPQLVFEEDLSVIIGKMKEEIIALRSGIKVLTLELIDLKKDYRKLSATKVALDFEKMMQEEAERHLSELRRK